MFESELVRHIENDLRLQKEVGPQAVAGDLDAKWERKLAVEPNRFINPDMTIRTEALREFRKVILFVSDEPLYKPSPVNPRNWISGQRRAIKRLLRDSFSVLEDLNYVWLLEKYPCSDIGAPYVFQYKGCRFTFRWAKHIQKLGLFRDNLGDKLEDNFTLLDIGSTYGVLSYLLKREYPRSCQILLDFSEQLALAHYFLGMNFPDAKIASFNNLMDVECVDRTFLEGYDFVLLPWFLYHKFSAKSLDVVTNSASLGEMRRKWFDYYLKHEPFLSARFFFTSNRFQSYPTYDTDLTILDYPLRDFKTLFFGVSPIYSMIYMGKWFIFWEKVLPSSQYFDFIGERKMIS